jgi:hypothetical protein
MAQAQKPHPDPENGTAAPAVHGWLTQHFFFFNFFFFFFNNK